MSEDVDPTETISAPSVATEQARPPRVLGARYLLEALIASGGMASVWRAHDEKLARTVAVKVLHSHLADDRDFRERFRREAVAAAKLSHPHIVGVFDTGTDGDQVYLVMEYVPNVTLRDAVAEASRLDVGQAVAITVKVARALDFAHARGLVHRDVKPANILLGEDGAVKIADFGIVKAEEVGEDLTRSGTVLGTAAYVSPEHVLGQPLDGRADQYSLACVLYEALTGRQPFRADTTVATAAQRLDADPLPARSLRPELPRRLDQALLRALARSPHDRFPTIGAFADALYPWADEETEPLAVASPFDPVTDGMAADARASDGAEVDDQRRSSFLSSEGRWIGPVLVLLALAAVLVGVGMAAGVIEPQTVPNLFAQNQEVPDDVATPAPLGIARLATFDPPAEGGDGAEHNDRLAALTDDDPATVWRTDRYANAEFGGLKTGVGLVLDLGAPTTVTQLELLTPTPGISYEVYVADEPSLDSLASWQRIGTVTDAQSGSELDLDGAETRWLLVRFVAPLQPDGSGYVAAVAELGVRGR